MAQKTDLQWAIDLVQNADPLFGKAVYISIEGHLLLITKDYVNYLSEKWVIKDFSKLVLYTRIFKN